MAVVNYTVANGELIAETRGGIRSLYVPDPLGSTIALFNASQTKTDTWVYWPYGEVKTRTGTTPTPFQDYGAKGFYRNSSSITYAKVAYMNVVVGALLSPSTVIKAAYEWDKPNGERNRNAVLLQTAMGF